MPAVPIAAWRGGKKNLARRIIERIEAIPHRCYAEPFVGMGGVFLRRRHRPKSEIINDINAEVMNLFQIMREHPDELLRQFDWAVCSRAEFSRLLATPPEVLTDVQRAARFAYIQKQSFGGRPATVARPGQMAPSPSEPARFSVSRMRSLIAAAHLRLQGVQVEWLAWDAFIRRYDRPFTLFYVDPPYWGHEADYGKGLFDRADYARMAEILRGIRGRFILSINDRPEIARSLPVSILRKYGPIVRPAGGGRNQPRNCWSATEGGGGSLAGLTTYVTSRDIHLTSPTISASGGQGMSGQSGESLSLARDPRTVVLAAKAFHDQAFWRR